MLGLGVYCDCCCRCKASVASLPRETGVGSRVDLGCRVYGWFSIKGVGLKFVLCLL